MRPLLRPGLVTAAVLLLAGFSSAQPVNPYILTNGPDATFLGVGAGGAQTAADGLGTWIPGEDLKGAHVTSLGEFGFRMPTFRENLCLTGPQPPGGFQLRFPLIAFIEFDGLNGNAPPIFTDPACTVPSFPLGSSGAIPYGTGPASSVSFMFAAVPPGLPTTVSTLLLPENGLLGSAGGQANFIAVAGGLALGVGTFSGCFEVTFTWQPSALPLADDIDGLWHWVSNSPDNNQYWEMSTDEMNIWQSYSVLSDQGGTAVTAFTANVDYALLISSRDPDTIATLAPRGLNQSGAYYGQTLNVSNEFGFSVNPNMGFDAGRGSRAISFSGLAGVANPTTNLGNQDPSNNPGTVTTLGFATIDNGSDGNGSVRLTWLAIDFLHLAGGDPASDHGIVVNGLRVPTVSSGFLQPLTLVTFGLFGHVTRPGWPDVHDPSGVAIGPHKGGASNQLPIGPVPAACIGTAFNITYGTSGRLGSVGSPGPITWNPAIADVSGTRQLFLFD